MHNPFVILSCAEATIALVFTRQLTLRHAYLPSDCGSDFILHKICSSSLLGRREETKSTEIVQTHETVALNPINPPEFDGETINYDMNSDTLRFQDFKKVTTSRKQREKANLLQKPSVAENAPSLI